MLKGILSISGHPGLFKLIAEAKANIVVESLENGKKIPVYSTSKVSALEDIAIYTDKGDVPLRDIFKSIYEKENGGSAVSSKASANDLKKYFNEAVPDYDKERVYVSDIKKIVSWYNILQEKGLLIFEEELNSEESEK